MLLSLYESQAPKSGLSRHPRLHRLQFCKPIGMGALALCPR